MTNIRKTYDGSRLEVMQKLIFDLPHHPDGWQAYGDQSGTLHIEVGGKRFVSLVFQNDVTPEQADAVAILIAGLPMLVKHSMR